MKVKELIETWEKHASTRLTAHELAVRLPLRDAARIAALAEMYPLRSEQEIITELLSAALDELETSLPYVQGARVIAEDDQGDPIYEDVGPTPRFHALTRKHLRRLESET
ncbi:MAG: type 1 pili tip component [Pseudomonadota bacterium]